MLGRMGDHMVNLVTRDIDSFSNTSSNFVGSFRIPALLKCDSTYANQLRGSASQNRRVGEREFVSRASGLSFSLAFWCSVKVGFATVLFQTLEHSPIYYK